MKRCALLTCESLEGHCSDEKPLEKALEDKNWSYEWIDWRKDPMDWNTFDCVIIRTTWDYTQDLESFLECLKKIDKSDAKLLNPLNLVRWNSDKKYIKQLEEQGIPVVPTEWISNFKPKEFLESRRFSEPLIVKPQVGAGAANTFFLKNLSEPNLEEKLKALIGSEVMVQPFIASVQSEGEYSVHFFNKKLSHTILKKPKPGDFRSQEEFGSVIKSIELNKKDLDFCEKVLSQILETYLYARVDFVKDEKGLPCLMELELIEPSLYFRFNQKSANLFVQELERILAS